MKINVRNFDNIWFISDMHIGHKLEPLYLDRNCESRDDHVKFIIDKINQQANENDLIISLGDLCLTSTFDEFTGWLTQINCKNIYSIIGNHDNRFVKLIDEFKQLSDPKSIADDYSNNVVNLYLNKDIRSLGKFKELTINEPSKAIGKKDIRYPITLCHFPLLIWNKSQYGAYCLCGHSHNSCVASHYENPNGKLLDCGVESALEYSENENIMFGWGDIKSIMNKKSILNIDHHN